jgi:hypothetical protein
VCALSIGYTPQTVVPLYVRNTLYEKEGTSVMGDPTQEELALDRRYSHYLGRPLVRFNPPSASTLPLDGNETHSTLGQHTAGGTISSFASDGITKKTMKKGGIGFLEEGSNSLHHGGNSSIASQSGMLVGDDLSVLTKQYYQHANTVTSSSTSVISKYPFRSISHSWMMCDILCIFVRYE